MTVKKLCQAIFNIFRTQIELYVIKLELKFKCSTFFVKNYSFYSMKTTKLEIIENFSVLYLA